MHRTIVATILSFFASITLAAEYKSNWSTLPDRVFIGPEFWANRLQDWKIAGGRLECVPNVPNRPVRTLHHLTRSIMPSAGEVVMNVQLGVVPRVNNTNDAIPPDAAAGFLIGIGRSQMDYRAAALVHQSPGPGGGYFFGISGAGQVMMFDLNAARPKSARRPIASAEALPREINLRLTTRNVGSMCEVSVTASANGRTLGKTEKFSIPSEKLAGGVALVSHPGDGKNTATFWFRDWSLGGAGVRANDDRAFGPVIGALYTVHRNILKMTIQFPPLGVKDPMNAELQIILNGKWTPIAKGSIEAPSYTAMFRLFDWNPTTDIPYRIVYPADSNVAVFEGIVRPDPVSKPTIVVAATSCIDHCNGAVGIGNTFNWTERVWFPHSPLVDHMAKHQPDLCYFAGDQIDDEIPTSAVRSPESEANLDYLYRWFLWHWTFRDLVKNTPTICNVDEEDVFQTALWGMKGEAARSGDITGMYGGYAMPPDWINMVERTQTSHLPDPFDPTPVDREIGVYYTSLTWGQVGFAVIEDRKFKSTPLLVPVRMSNVSHIAEPGYDTHNADVPGAVMLGDRQLEFLRYFGQDWNGQVMKSVLSQTNFCNLQINSKGETAGQLDRDLDSNGWPQTPRNAALRELRRAFMVHIAGDNRLASVLRHGVDDWEDSCWTFSVPSGATTSPRFWNPDFPPNNFHEGMTPFTGRYLDGFFNRMTIRAVANPIANPKQANIPEPVELNMNSVGYGIVRFNKNDRTITMEAWPRHVDPAVPASGSQFAGWPITIHQTANFGRPEPVYLPDLEITGMIDPIVQIIQESSGEIVYTLRIQGNTFRPQVHHTGLYTIKVGELGTPKTVTLNNVRTIARPGEEDLDITVE